MSLEVVCAICTLRSSLPHRSSALDAPRTKAAVLIVYLANGYLPTDRAEVETTGDAGNHAEIRYRRYASARRPSASIKTSTFGGTP